MLIADHQTAGKERLDRRWVDEGGGSLLMSVRLAVPDDQVAGALVRALAGAARHAAGALVPLRSRSSGRTTCSWWTGRSRGSSAGVLAELVAGPQPSVVIGIGVNLAPVASQPEATSVVECGGIADRDRVAAAILDAFADRRADPARVIAEMRAHSAMLGTRVAVELPGGRRLAGVSRLSSRTGERSSWSPTTGNATR
ncbi:MAG: hypothetical protein R2695_03535 [Acidimicrobiales bacterium]